MRKKSQSSASGADEFSDESLDDLQVEAITSLSKASDQRHRSAAEEPAAAPGWTKRLPTRGKVTRALVTALVVIAALVILLPHPTFTLPPGVARLMTPAPTQTPLPGRLSTGEWEPVAMPPVQTAYFYDLVPSPVNPNTAYACLFLESLDSGQIVMKSNIAELWVTGDAGYTWRQVELPTVVGVAGARCTVSPALDGSHRVTLSVNNLLLDQNAPPCAHSVFLLSEDDGATWRRIEHTVIAMEPRETSDCQLWSTARHLFMYTAAYSNATQAYIHLQRSDDGGSTWLSADHGLGEGGAQWYAQPIDLSGDTLGALVGYKHDLWITRDAGAHWQMMGPISRDIVAQSLSHLVSEAGLGSWLSLCRCLYAQTLSPGYLSYTQGQRVYMSRDYVHWSILPPIPAQGTSATRSGVYQILGPTADGRLLALGVDPAATPIATPDANGQFNSPTPRLWAWNAHTNRWDLAGPRLPCKYLQSCGAYAIGASSVTQADGALRGTMLWLAGLNGVGQSQSAMFTTFRLFIPIS
jgi:hypothetical protein